MSDYIAHVGVKRKSGRYPWGSGKHPYQDEPWFKGWAEGRKKGIKESELAKMYGFKSSTEGRYMYSYGKDAEHALDIATAKKYRFDRQMSISAIAKKMNTSEANIRKWLDPAIEERNRQTRDIMDHLEAKADEKKAIDVGKGIAQAMGQTPTKIDAALTNIKNEGYNVITIKVPQANNPKQKTTYKFLCSPDIGDGSERAAKRYCYENLDKIGLPYELHYEDTGEGKTAANIYFPKSIDSKRIMVKYADVKYEDGHYGIERDGLIQIRRGVPDLSIGDNKYAQVRIAVDGDSYLKGMAVYSDDMPKGVDVIFNTNRSTANPLKKDKNNPLEPVLKSMEKDPVTGKVDEDNPFGAQIQRQFFYTDKDGKKQLGAVNIVSEEGKWGDWTSARTLASQVLSKQDINLAKRQLNLEYAKYQKEYEDILNVENPTVRRKLLEDFAEECDKASVHLKAAALPRQSVGVLIPIPSLKDNEIYAPGYKDGEKVVLIRYPHGGKFEIPELIVNNNNREGRKVLGTDPSDCVGINRAAAMKLSGADFDGDTALVIPNNKNYIQTQKTFESLKNFDPSERYPYREGMKVMTKQDTQKQMGSITNLITDMQIIGAKDEELVRAVKHSMVVIDAAKHKLDYKTSEIDNGIAELKKKYQLKDSGRYGGASTLLSRASSEDHPYERIATREKIDPKTGERIHSESGRSMSWYKIDPKTGDKVYYHEIGEKAPSKSTIKNLPYRVGYDALYPNQPHYNPDPKQRLTQESTKMFEAKHAYELSSGTKMEAVYADYANSMKAFANQARLESLGQKNIPYDKQAAETYHKEVEEIENNIKVHETHAPINRQVELSANAIINQKIKDNPEVYNKKTPDGRKQLRKLRSQVVARQRAKFGQKAKLEITDKQWQAVQAGAVKITTLRKLIDYGDQDRIRELATPRNSSLPLMSAGNISLAKAMLNSGYTLAQVADALNVSASTVSKYTK